MSAMPAPGLAEEVVPFPKIDPDKNQIICVFGRKGAGKSVFASELFIDWPHIDKLVIDPTGDANAGPGAVTVHQLPAELPQAPRGKHTVLRYVPDPRSSTYAEDLDRALELALYPRNRRVLVYVDEAGRVFPTGSKGQTGPAGRTLLEQSRHFWASLILCAPRAVGLDPLAIAQADRIVMYDLPAPQDRARIAETIGVPQAELVPLLNELRRPGMEHWFLMYIAGTHELLLCEPVPIQSATHRAAQH